MATVVERRVPFEGIQNFRDLGGYPTAGGGEVRWGQLYRGAALHKLTPADVVAFGRLGVRTVYDLRGDVERTEFPVRSTPSRFPSSAGPKMPSPRRRRRT